MLHRVLGRLPQRRPLETKLRFHDCITGQIAGTGRLVLGPVDDVLLSGAELGLYDLRDTIVQEARGGVDAMLMFRGTLKRHGFIMPAHVARIVNASASTTVGRHTRKVPFGWHPRHRAPFEVAEDVIRLGGDAIAFHINVSSRYEPEMLTALGGLAIAADKYQLPLLVLAYPRTEGPDGHDYNYRDLRANDRAAFTKLVRHCVGIAVNAGADIVKTVYTGDPDSFATVVRAAQGVPVLIAGEAETTPLQALINLHGALEAGAAGPAYGRNIYNSGFTSDMTQAVVAVTHHGLSPLDAAELFRLIDVEPPPMFAGATDFRLHWQDLARQQEAWRAGPRSGGRRGI
jgi:DhnA family fructose-bisphosphate aldolase class Ia